MRLIPAQAAQLLQLAEGRSLPRSRISRSLLPLLEKAGVIRNEKSGSSYLVRGIPGKIETLAEHTWGIRDLRRFAQAIPRERSRESLAETAGDSKALPNQPLTGLLIRSFGSCILAGESLARTPFGSAIFISPKELPGLQVTADMLIAVENSACFLKFEKTLQFFPELDLSNVALVLRWNWGVAWREWLGEWKGQMFYFPDYDRAGLRIFASEVLRHRPEARLLIPANLAALIRKHGSRRLFLRQEHLALLNAQHPDIAMVQAGIDSSRKALEQESLLNPATARD
jgi:hypothetical protein